MLRWIAPTLLLALPAPSLACEPEPQQLCGRTAWTGAAVDGSVAVPGPSQTVDLGVELTGALKWGSEPTQQGDCAQPLAVQATGSVVCEALASGDELARTDFDEAIAVPPGTGPWDLSAVEALLQLEAGEPGEPAQCFIEGTLTVAFEADGLGTGDLVARFDADVAVLERSVAEPTRPRLSVFRLLPTRGVNTWPAGDEALLWFVVENLDLEADADVDFQVLSDGLATAPESEDIPQIDFALGGPGGLDLLLASQATADLIGGGDPVSAGSSLAGSFTVPAGGATVLPVLARSAARCPDDSGADVRFVVDADWGDSQASAGASTVVRQGLTSPRSPQCVITDSIASAATVDGRWGPAIIDDTPWLATHPAGNLDPDAHGARTRVPGFSFAEPYPNPADDVLRAPNHPASISWTADLFPTQLASAGETQHLEVEVTNLSDVDALNLPAIFDTGAAGNFSYALDAGAEHITLTDLDSGDVRFEGGLTDFFSATPPGLTMDLDTIRQFTFDCAQQADPILLPRSTDWAKTLSADDGRVDIELLDRRSGAGLSWTAAVVDGPGYLTSDGGAAGQTLGVEAVLDDLPEWPLRAPVRISIVTPAVNSPLEVVVLLAREPEVVGDDDDAADDDDDDSVVSDDDDDVTLGGDDVGCGCQTTPASGWLLLPLLFLRRRRCN